MSEKSLVSFFAKRNFTRNFAASMAAFMLVLSLNVIGVQAAVPSSGQVSSDSPTATYTAGPFLVANTTGTLGDVQCDATTPCDDFKLTVNTPAGYGTDHTMTIKIDWPNSAADFDLYVLNSQGVQVASAASSSDPEVVTLPPDSGVYTIRVVPYAPLGESFKGTIALEAKGTNPAPSTETAPTYTNYAAPETLPNAHNAGEPSIGVNWNTNSVMYQAYYSTYRVKFNDSTSPATATWLDKSAGLPECTAETSLDPILFTDHQTGRTFESQLLVNPVVNSLTCYTNDDGDTWNISEGGGVGSGVDHQTVGGGPFSATGIGAITSYPNAVYYCSQDIVSALCSASHDGGVTFNPAVPVYTFENCSGLHGHVKVAPNGAVYLPNGHCGGKQAVAISLDNGNNWAVRQIPNSTQAIGSDPAVNIGSNGTVYFGYQDGSGQARIAVSNDQGETWVNDQDVGAQLGIKNIVFPSVVAGDDDRAAFAFLGTTTAGDYGAADFKGVWHLYVATTYDGGKSWITADATPNDPVQRGPICTEGTTCGDSRNLLDFMGVDVDKEGRVVVGYADGCTGACVQADPNNYDELATIARQTTGKRLFAKYDPKPDLTTSNIQVVQGYKQSTVTATVTNDNQAAAQNVVVRLLDGSTFIADSVSVDLAPGESKQVSVVWDTQKLKGDHVVTAIVDPNNAIAESKENNNKAQVTVTLK